VWLIQRLSAKPRQIRSMWRRGHSNVHGHYDLYYHLGNWRVMCVYKLRHGFKALPSTWTDPISLPHQLKLSEQLSEPLKMSSRDFIDPDNFAGGRGAHYSNVQGLIDRFGPQSAGNLVRGVPSSAAYSILNLDAPFITGSGPSWGCTSLTVFSDKGIWLAHFWETDNIQDPDGFQNTINFLQNGAPGFPSLASVVDQYFGDDALFVKANIWTPNEVRARRVASFPDRTGKAPTDAVWYPQVDAMTTKITEIIPAVNRPAVPGTIKSQVSTVTYRVFSATEQLSPTLPTELKLFAVEYVPAYIRQAGQCTFARAFRLHIQGQIVGPIIWPWPPGPTSSRKRQAVGACPANIGALLAAQAPDASDTEFMSLPDPTTSPVQTQASQAQASSTIPDSLPTLPVPTTMVTSVIDPGPTMCANLQFLPGGGSVGSNCNGDPNLTVTFPPVRKRSLPTPAP